jgi:hypothetical protein
MLLREATLKDVPVIARVHVDTWQTTYRGIVPDSYLAQLNEIAYGWLDTRVQFGY